MYCPEYRSFLGNVFKLELQSTQKSHKTINVFNYSSKLIKQSRLGSVRNKWDKRPHSSTPERI